MLVKVPMGDKGQLRKVTFLDGGKRTTVANTAVEMPDVLADQEPYKTWLKNGRLVECSAPVKPSMKPDNADKMGAMDEMAQPDNADKMEKSDKMEKIGRADKSNKGSKRNKGGK